jgi:hypothetical protein
VDKSFGELVLDQQSAKQYRLRARSVSYKTKKNGCGQRKTSLSLMSSLWLYLQRQTLARRQPPFLPLAKIGENSTIANESV